ncbi:MAG TPA: response regulator transcription factor [Rugosimonospora sp.]|nr:response regulator transcription factor [Rugosimonospora sp.]
MIRLLIVSELGLLRGALRAVLSHEGDLAVSEVGPRRDVAVAAQQARPDVILVDLAQDERAGLETARRLVDAVPGCALVALAEKQTPGLLRQALEAGVRGFTSTEQPPEELAELIRRVAGGDRVIDPDTARAALAAADNPLTAREREVLNLAAEGLPTKAIARSLYLTDGTVRNHVWSILRKTGTRNRMQAIRLARDAGWI